MEAKDEDASIVISRLRDEVQNLSDDLLRYGEESIILTVNPANKDSTYFGSAAGRDFLMSKLEFIQQFYQFCLGRYRGQELKEENQLSSATTFSPNTGPNEEKSVDSSADQISHVSEYFDKSEAPLVICNDNDVRGTLTNNLNETVDSHIPNSDNHTPGSVQKSMISNVNKQRDDNNDGNSVNILVGQKIVGKLVKQNKMKDDSKTQEYSFKSVKKKSNAPNKTKSDPDAKIEHERTSSAESKIRKSKAPALRLKTTSVSKTSDSSRITRAQTSGQKTADKKESGIRKGGVKINMSKLTSRRLYNCIHCDKVYLTASRLSSHVRTAHGNLMTKHTCNVCNESFSKEKGLSRHRVNQGHAQACDICGKEFIHTPEFKRHMCYHRSEKRKTEKIPVKCEFCPKQFWNKGDLNKHRRVHTKERPYMCDVCGHRFSIPSQLSCHRRIHTGEKPYTCNDCGKKFSLSNTLARHRRKHTGDKYQCHLCGKEYASRWNMMIHLDYIHTGLTPFKCEFCGKEFNRKDNLKTHKKKHEREMTKAIQDTEMVKGMHERDMSKGSAANMEKVDMHTNMYISGFVESAVQSMSNTELLHKPDTSQYYMY